MIIFFKRNAENGFSMPVALLDYTRSDDQYTEAEVLKFTREAAKTVFDTDAGVNYSALSIFSLSYKVVYRHSGINLQDALKTKVEVSIANAPPELSSLINVKQIVGQESALSLESATKLVIDAQNQFPYGVLFFDVPAAGGGFVTISKKFIVYGTVFNFDPKRINSTLEVKGAAFDSMVMRLQLAVNLNQKSFLIDQLRKALASTGYQITPSDTGVATATPVVERYYPPAPLNRILAAVCQDNGLFFDTDEKNKTIRIQGLDSKTPPKEFLPKRFCFRATPPGEYLISTFSVQDYACAQLRAELTGMELFSSIEIYNDSGADGLFDNFREKPGSVGSLKAYPFYVLQYAYILSSYESVLELYVANNWLLSNFKLSTLFENAVYAGVK